MTIPKIKKRATATPTMIKWEVSENSDLEDESSSWLEWEWDPPNTNLYFLSLFFWQPAMDRP